MAGCKLRGALRRHEAPAHVGRSTRPCQSSRQSHTLSFRPVSSDADFTTEVFAGVLFDCVCEQVVGDLLQFDQGKIFSLKFSKNGHMIKDELHGDKGDALRTAKYA